MAGEDGNPDRRLTFIAALGRTPERYDFYQVLRRLEACSPGMPRLGEARRPMAEPLRLGQEAELSFAISNITKVGQTPTGVPRVFVRFLGLFGPQGPLPMHLTELTRDRERHHGDPALARFADTFHHRMLLLFYRAWRQAQPTATRDRPADDRFRTYVGALHGHGSPGWQRPALGMAGAKRHFAGHLGRSVRNPDGLAAILSAYFRVPVEVQTFQPRWMTLPRSQRSALGGQTSAALGLSAVIGARVLDAQHHIRVAIGPVDHATYLRLLPDGDWAAPLREWIREYCGEEFGVSGVTRLEAADVPSLRLGEAGRLGWSSWLGRRQTAAPADDLSLNLSAATATH